MSKADTQMEFQKQVDVFVENKVDFLIAEVKQHQTHLMLGTLVCFKAGKVVLRKISYRLSRIMSTFLFRFFLIVCFKACSRRVGLLFYSLTSKYQLFLVLAYFRSL